MLRLIIISLIYLLLNINICYSQNDWKPGYIIKSEGDTIYGFIDNRDSKSNSKRCYFRKEVNEKTQVYTPEELIGYRYINDKFYISKSIEGLESEKPVFLEFIIQGRVNVYHYKDENDQYFIKKDDSIYELKNTLNNVYVDDVNYLKEKKEYIGTLNFLLKDGYIHSDILKSSFETKSLVNIVKKYHNNVCPDEKCIIYERIRKPIHIKKGLYTGLLYNKISFGGLLISNYSFGSLIGFKLEFENVINWAENVTFVLDNTIQSFSSYQFNSPETFSYNIVTYNDQDYYLRSLDITSLNANIKTIALRIPVTINYTFSKGTIQPYIGAGLLSILILSQNKEFIFQWFYKEFHKSIPTYHYGLTGRTGCRYEFKNDQSLFLELNYDLSENYNINQFLRFTNKLFSVNLGYNF